jgi:hypothetical protein
MGPSHPFPPSRRLPLRPRAAMVPLAHFWQAPANLRPSKEEAGRQELDGRACAVRRCPAGHW